MTRGDETAPGALDPQTFGSAMGQAVWLMTMSKEHRDLPIRVVEQRIALPILFKQFRMYSKENQPVAFLTWASVSEEVQGRLTQGHLDLSPAEWRSGDRLAIVDVISPFNPPEVFRQRFLNSLSPNEGGAV